MRGDFTRLPFRPEHHFSGVYQQQGRVQLDSDWNEQLAIEHHVLRTTTADVIGPAGAPQAASGFGLAPAAGLYALDVSGGKVWVAGELGTALDADVTVGAATTSTAGWGPQSTSSTADLRGLAAVSATSAFAVGAAATIAKLTDGAVAQVQSAPAGVSADLAAVSFSDATHGIAVGASATIIATGNGSTWVAQSAPAGVTEPLHGVWCDADGAHAWAVGDSARILATADGGSTWTAQSPPNGVDADLAGVWFASDHLHGWAVGAGATLLATSDGGATWTAQSGPDSLTANLRAVHGESTTELWVVGDAATILYSDDGGTSWAQLDPPPALDADLFAVRATAAGQALAAGDLDTVLSLAAPSAAQAPELQALPSSAVDLSVSAGRMYVDGILVEAERAMRIGAQPDLPAEPFPSGPGSYVAYLDVWERHLTAVERPDLREVALGGPDTATRTQVVWQVKLGTTTLSEGATCASFGPGWRPDVNPPGLMRARAQPAPLSSSDCIVPANGGYQRLENQLYRVEVHDGGPAGTATFKWSRDNGSMVSLLEAIDDTTDSVTVSTLGPDDVIGLTSAALIELSDESRALSGEAGDLLPVQKVGPEPNTIFWNSAGVPAPPQISDFGSVATVRRWDGRGTVTPDGWLDLEAGVQVEFAAEGEFRTGDYWLIPARTLTAEIDWPQHDGVETFEPPDGIRHHYVPLGIVALSGSGQWSVISECRVEFPPLTAMTRFFYVGGDGQESDSNSGQPLPEPLEVGVMNGRRPVPGARVEFDVLSGDGTLAPVSGAGGGTDSLVVSTDSTGTAACVWSLGAGGADQRVQARLLDDSGDPTSDTPLHFNATTEAPAQGGGVCTVSARPGDDLQAAIEALLKAGGGELCLAAGRWELEQPLRVLKAPFPITITGRGASTVLAFSRSLIGIEVVACADVTLRQFAVDLGDAGATGDAIQAAVHVLRCERVTIGDCLLQTEASVSKLPPACFLAQTVTGTLRLERNRLAPAAGHTACSIDNARVAVLVRNDVEVTPTASAPTPGRLGQLRPAIVAAMEHAVAARQSIDTVGIPFELSRQVINVDATSPTVDLWRLYARYAVAVKVTDVKGGLAKFVGDLIEAQSTSAASLSPEIRAMFKGAESVVGKIALSFDLVGDGIVVTGDADTVELLDNVLEQIGGAPIQIALIGTAQGQSVMRQEVLLSRNVISCGSALTGLVGVRVNNATSLHILDTIITQSGQGKGEIGILVTGTVGPFVVVRQTSLRGFGLGVSLADIANPTNEQVFCWLVAETMTADSGTGTNGAGGVAVPAGVGVSTERNFIS